VAVRGYLGRYGDTIGILTGEPGHLTVRPGPTATNPSYLAVSPGGVLYAAIESDSGAVAAYAIEGESLRPLGDRPTGGAGTCHLSVHPSGDFVLSADYGSGTIAVHPVGPDGGLGERTDLIRHEGSGPNRDRQRGPHAHMIIPAPSGDSLLATDLGTDTVYRYELSARGRLKLATKVSVSPGSGPRHVAFHPAGRFAYVVNELSSSVSVLDLESFTFGPTIRSQAGDDERSSSPSAIRVSADGRFCYVANRGPDVIATLAISPQGDQLRLVETVPAGGEHPRDIALTGEYMYVANQHSGTVTTFSVDAATGQLTPVGASVRTAAPSCVLLL
jgi:6-phosphogluconolactonase (cycloisomerase 2 family)